MLGYKNLNQVIRVYSIIAGFVVIGFIVRYSKFEAFGREKHINITIFSFFLIMAFWESLRLVHYFLNKYYPIERSIPKRIILQVAIGIVIGLMIRAVVYKWGEPYIPFKLDSMFIATTWALYAIFPIGINLGFFTVYFIDQWKASLIEAERLEKEKSQVQFDNLKNQLNPHFLFNALTSLNSLIFENQQLASQFVQQLSKVYRYVLQNKDKNFVQLSTELSFISNYVQLLETRFQGALKIHFEISEEAQDKAIVPVTLQILIENAIKHNVVDKERKLIVEILTVGDYLVVSNNFQLRKSVETSNKQGLDNLKSLYRFLTDKPVIVEQTEERFFVKVPLI